MVDDGMKSVVLFQTGVYERGEFVSPGSGEGIRVIFKHSGIIG